MILDFIKKERNIFFLFHLLIVFIIVKVQKFESIFFFLLLGSSVFFAVVLYVYCKFIVNSKLSLNFEVGILISQMITAFNFVQVLLDSDKNKASAEIIILSISYSVFSILYAEKFNISGKLFK